MEGISKFEKFKMTKVNQSPAVKKERKSIKLNATTHIGDLFDDMLTFPSLLPSELHSHRYSDNPSCSDIIFYV